MNIKPKTISVAEAHELIGLQNLSRPSMYAAVKRGDFPSLKIGDRYLILAEPFHAMLAGKRAAA